MQEELTPDQILNLGVKEFYEIDDYDAEKIAALKNIFGFCSLYCEKIDSLYGHVYLAVTSIVEKGFKGDKNIKNEIRNIEVLIKDIDFIINDSYRSSETRESAFGLKHFAVTWYVTSGYKERNTRCIEYLQSLESDMINNDFSLRDENYTEVMGLLGDCRMAAGKTVDVNSYKKDEHPYRKLLEQIKLENSMENMTHILKPPERIHVGYILDGPEEKPYRNSAARIEASGRIEKMKLMPINLN